MTQQISPPKAFVAGWPIAHSRSPALHGFWLKQLKIAGSYVPVAVPPDGFGDFLDGFSSEGFAGGNVTIPHKETAFELVEKPDATGEILGALNTLWLEDGVVYGTNTDAYGFSANLDALVPEWVKGSTAIVLGAGGASRAVIYAILQAGYSNIHIINRTRSRAQALADRFGSCCSAHGWDAFGELAGDTGLLVNTTSLGMQGGDEAAIPKLDELPAGAIVTDIVYTPLETALLIAAKNLGYQTVDGLGMLLHQAVPGFEKWFGTRPQVSEALRRHVLNAGNSTHNLKGRS